MSWNHRVIKTIHKSKLRDGKLYEEETFAIHEVHYPHQGDDTPVGATVHPVAPVAESLEGLRWTLTQMLEALDKPVLTEEDFPARSDKPKEFGELLPWEAIEKEGA